MKLIAFLKVFGVIALTVLFEVRVFSEESVGETLKFKYNFQEPKILSAGEYARVTITGISQYRVEGEPVLPVKTIRVLLPFGRTYSAVNVSASPMRAVEGKYMIEPGQSSFIFQTERIPPDPRVYSSADPYPTDVFQVVTLQNKRGYLILYINLFPVRYIPSTLQLSWCSEMEVEITTRPAPVAQGYRGLAKDRALIRSQVDNPRTTRSYVLRDR